MQRADTAGAADPDFLVLRHVARDMHVRVHLSADAKRASKPHIELYRSGPGKLQLGAFRSAATALAWLQGRAS